ncbi:MAG: RecX family transcriptional regulator [Alphaproteobacteria bacterium]|nr:RecX family transcriptional regulator [Alphaproteobacteria bacterium]
MKKLTEKRLYHAALAYVAKFSASSGMVRDVLNRKVFRARRAQAEIPPETPAWIDKIVASFVQAGYVDDGAYAAVLVGRLSGQGKSAYFIRQKLMRAHLSAEEAEDALGRDAATDVQRARMFAAKKKLKRTPQDLAKLARAGFSYETAREALGGADETEGEA